MHSRFCDRHPSTHDPTLPIPFFFFFFKDKELKLTSRVQNSREKMKVSLQVAGCERAINYTGQRVTWSQEQFSAERVQTSGLGMRNATVQVKCILLNVIKQCFLFSFKETSIYVPNKLQYGALDSERTKGTYFHHLRAGCSI